MKKMTYFRANNTVNLLVNTLKSNNIKLARALSLQKHRNHLQAIHIMDLNRQINALRQFYLKCNAACSALCDDLSQIAEPSVSTIEVFPKSTCNPTDQMRAKPSNLRGHGNYRASMTASQLRQDDRREVGHLSIIDEESEIINSPTKRSAGRWERLIQSPESNENTCNNPPVRCSNENPIRTEDMDFTRLILDTAFCEVAAAKVDRRSNIEYSDDRRDDDSNSMEDTATIPRLDMKERFITMERGRMWKNWEEEDPIMIMSQEFSIADLKLPQLDELQQVPQIHHYDNAFPEDSPVEIQPEWDRNITYARNRKTEKKKRTNGEGICQTRSGIVEWR